VWLRQQGGHAARQPVAVLESGFVNRWLKLTVLMQKDLKPAQTVINVGGKPKTGLCLSLLQFQTVYMFLFRTANHCNVNNVLFRMMQEYRHYAVFSFCLQAY